MSIPPVVALIIGPYRNLTTLTASLLALHPECQVLNHAGSTLLADSRYNFLKNGNFTAFQAFVHEALSISVRPLRGWQGGSILSSHAFASNPALLSKYRGRFGDMACKEHISALIWKESLKVSLQMRESKLDLETLFNNNPQLRFILPVRNPLDCAVSNLKTGHWKLLPKVFPDTRFENVLAAVLNEIHWGLALERQFAGRFMHFFQFESPPIIFGRLLSFLNLPPDKEWFADACALFKVRESYRQDRAAIDRYIDLVEDRFRGEPELRSALLRFVQQGADGLQST